jgi:phage terminase large subunit GpA-like protein
LVSTPKITGMSRIEAAFEESDKRLFCVPCPVCREFQVLKFPQLRWPKGEPEKAAYVCEHCGQQIQNHQKQWMLPRGQWRATAKGDGKTAGFHLSSLYSPVGWFSWGEAAKQFEQAQKNPSLLQVFVNTVLGDTWTLLGEAPDWKKLYDRREPYKTGIARRGALFLVAGADVQKDRIEVEVVAYGRGKESWSVDYRVFEGDTSRPQVWQKLTALVNETYPSETGVDMPILQMAVDSGYATTEVYQWARKQGHRVLVIKGDARAAAILSAPSPIEVGPLGGKLKRGVRVWPVNSGMAKEELYRWLRLDRPTDEDLEGGIPFPPGFCHFPRYGEEYFKQLTAEQLVTKLVKGYRRMGWQKMRERNEALDCRVYARAAAARVGMDRFNERHWKSLEEQIGAATQEKADQPAASPNAVVRPSRPAPTRRVVRSRYLDR